MLVGVHVRGVQPEPLRIAYPPGRDEQVRPAHRPRALFHRTVVQTLTQAAARGEIDADVDVERAATLLEAALHDGDRVAKSRRAAGPGHEPELTVKLDMAFGGLGGAGPVLKGQSR